MISCSLMIPNGFLSAMSCRDSGGSGRHPRDTNQRPPLGSQSVQSVRRKLFGDVDHNQTSLDLQRELRECEERDRSKYNFDFNSEQPLPLPSEDSRYEWSQISTDSNDTEEKTDFNISTKLCKISDKNIAQSSTTQSQSATSSPPEPQQELHSEAVLDSSKMSTSATLAPDSQPQSSSSGVQLTQKVGQKHKLVKKSKQLPITGMQTILFFIYSQMTIHLLISINYDLNVYASHTPTFTPLLQCFNVYFLYKEI